MSAGKRRDLPGRTFEFAKRVVRLCAVMEGKRGVSKVLVSQLLRAATSMGANVEEGQAGQSRADFVSKISIACKEARESHYWLRLLAATDAGMEEEMRAIIGEANELVAILTTIVKRTKERVNVE